MRKSAIKKTNKILAISIALVFIFPMIVFAAKTGGSGAGGGANVNDGGACSTSNNQKNKNYNTVCRLSGGDSPVTLYISLNPNSKQSERKKVKTYKLNQVKVKQIPKDLNEKYFNVSNEKRAQAVKKALQDYFNIDLNDASVCNSAYKGHIYFAVVPDFRYRQKTYSNLSVKQIANKCAHDSDFKCHSYMHEILDYLRVTDYVGEKKILDYNIAAEPKITNKRWNVSWSEAAKPKSGWGVYEVWVEASQICPPNITVVPLPTPKEQCVKRKINLLQTNPQCQSDANTRADFYENVDTSSSSGEGGVYGVPTSIGTTGSYCTFYCTEEAHIELPRGYNYPLQVGTKLVFPTSNESKSAGILNERPLSFKGKKTCRLDVAPNSQNCSLATENYQAFLDYVNQLKNKKDSKGRTYDSIRKDMEKNGSLAQTSWCAGYYPNASSESDINSRTNCQNYINALTYIRNILTGFMKCDSVTKQQIQNTGTSLYNFSSSARVKNDDVEYNKPISLVRESNASSGDYTYQFSGNWNSSGIRSLPAKAEVSSLYTKGQLDSIISKIENRVTTISTKAINYKLPTNTYNYIDKRTQKATSTKPSGAYTVVGYSNLPISNDAKKGIDIDLKLEEVTTGHNGRFKLNDYVCKYQVTNNSCICPDGTLNAGKDLTCKLDEMTCIEAQETYCDTELFDDDDCDRYKCKNSNNVGGKMDITACVLTRQKQGATLQEAIDYCDHVVCPLGIPIIYRVISLKNPFPGKNIAHRVAGFNLEVVGRYPGANWNSEKLVKTQILNNRGVKADEVYKKEPLYVFDLDAGVVKNIRAYNDNTSDGYTDFTLDCIESADKNETGTKCISKKFVHDRRYGLVSGTCQHATGFSAFEECVEK